jgi:hypothetical protein
MYPQTIIGGPRATAPIADYVQETITAVPQKVIHAFGHGNYLLRVVTPGAGTVPGVVLAANGLDAVLCDGFNGRQVLALVLAAVSAKLSGLPLGPAIIRAADDSANRISVNFDASNNRTSVTYTPPA